MLKVKLPEALNTQNFIFRVLSWLFMVWTLTAILQQKYVIHTFGEMYKVFSQFPINKVLFNKKLDWFLSKIKDIFNGRHILSFQ